MAFACQGLAQCRVAVRRSPLDRRLNVCTEQVTLHPTADVETGLRGRRSLKVMTGRDITEQGSLFDVIRGSASGDFH
jgi:hypothetical protein